MEDRRTRLPRASTMAYKELRPLQPANDGNGTQLPFAEEACVAALAGLATVYTSVQKAIRGNALPAELGTSLRYVIFLSLLFFSISCKMRYFKFSSFILRIPSAADLYPNRCIHLLYLLQRSDFHFGGPTFVWGRCRRTQRHSSNLWAKYKNAF